MDCLRKSAHLPQQCHNSKSVMFQAQAASFANCVMTLYLLKVRLQTFISMLITQKWQILSFDTLVANERNIHRTVDRWGISTSVPLRLIEVFVEKSAVLSTHCMKITFIRITPKQVTTYLLTCLLTPCCRALLEQLTALQLVKKFPAFHGTRRFITALISVRYLSLSGASPIQSTHIPLPGDPSKYYPPIYA